MFLYSDPKEILMNVSRKDYLKDWRRRKRNDIPTIRQQEYLSRNRTTAAGVSYRKCKRCENWKELKKNFKPQKAKSKRRRFICNDCRYGKNSRKNVKRRTNRESENSKRRNTSHSYANSEMVLSDTDRAYFIHENDRRNNKKAGSNDSRKVNLFICVLCERELDVSEQHSSEVCCKKCAKNI